MKTRIISGLIFAFVLFVVFYVGGALMYTFGTAISIIALDEFYKAVSGKTTKLNYISMVCAVLLFAVAYFELNSDLIIVCILFMLFNFIYLIAHHQNIELKELFANVFAFFYIVPSILTMMLIRDRTMGLYLILFVFISASVTDTFAYFIGKAIGKHKLAPHLSPNKTIEGSVGGTLVSTILFVALALLVNYYQPIFEANGISMTILVGVGVILSILSQLGDLSASAIKRITGIKDYGNLIPGHGGILDRFDSSLFTAPGIFVALTLLVY